MKKMLSVLLALADGGDISGKKINSSGVPNGDYKVCIINAGSKSITGALQYEVK